MNSAITLVWFRQDLRLADNPALAAAASRGRVVPLYLLDEEAPDAWGLGGAQRWWLHHSLARLSESLSAKGAPLILRRGRAIDAIPQIAREVGASHVAWNRCYEPSALARDKALKGEILPAKGIEVDSHQGNLLREPWQIKNGAGQPFKVFTPFWRTLSAALGEEKPLPAPANLKGVSGLESEPLESWQLLPSKPNWASGFAQDWAPGEEGARKKLSRFFKEALANYKDGRDRPDLPLTSRLSPHLHFGEISARQIYFAARHQAAQSGQSADKFLSEVGWREFAHGLLFHWPTLPKESWKVAFGSFPWIEDRKGLRAWQQGKTGYPLVDAGMRELWQTGWMHNRVRMIVASFLVKDLLIAWQEGARWFWDTLLDADLANNSASWQWVAGSGADAAPYFRVFNPVIQGERFDPEGNYVRRFVPELAKLPVEFIHRPWEAPANILADAGVKLGQTYPLPIVDHGAARARALAALASIKQEAS